MYANTQVFGHNFTTAAARLRRIGGVHRRDVTTSIHRFVAQQPLEQPESSIVRRQGQVFVAGHESQIQVFQGNQAVVADQPGRNLMTEVPARVGDMFVQFGDDKPSVGAVLSSLLGTGKAALRPAQLVKTLTQPSRVVDLGAVREGQQPQQAHVAAHSGQAVRFGGQRVGRVQHQEHVPAGSFPLDDDVLDQRAGRPEAVKLDLDRADALNLQHHPVVVCVVFHVGAVAVGVLDTLEAARPLKRG